MSHELRTIETFKLSHRAYILEALLEEEGIESFLSEETVLGQIDGVKVMVDDSNYERAMVVYRTFEAENQN
jgi:hypothetical protein